MMTLEKRYTTEHCYLKYSGQINPQDAFLVLDTEDGTVSAHANGEIGNAVPMRVWCGLDIRIPFCRELQAGAINNLMDEIEGDLQAVLNGATVDWDGSNWVGTLTDDARAALERACAYAEEYGDPDGDMLEIIGGDWWDSPREMAQTCIQRGCTPAALIDEILTEYDPDVVDTDTDRLAEMIQAEIDELEGGE